MCCNPSTVVTIINQQFFIELLLMKSIYVLRAYREARCQPSVSDSSIFARSDPTYMCEVTTHCLELISILPHSPCLARFLCPESFSPKSSDSCLLNDSGTSSSERSLSYSLVSLLFVLLLVFPSKLASLSETVLFSNKFIF